MLVYRKPGLYVSSLLLDRISACEFLCRCEQHLIDGRKTKMAPILTFPKGLFTIALASVHFFLFSVIYNLCLVSIFVECVFKRYTNLSSGSCRTQEQHLFDLSLPKLAAARKCLLAVIHT